MQNDLVHAVVQVAKACDAASGVQRDHKALGSKMSQMTILSRDVSDLTVELAYSARFGRVAALFRLPPSNR